MKTIFKTNYFKFLTIIIVVFACATAFSKKTEKDCSNAKDYAESAYNYFRKAYRTDNLDDAQSYAKKGMNEASSAEDEANDSDCDCDDAESNASDAKSYGKKAYNSNNLDDLQNYVKKAMYSSEEITSSANECEEEE